MTWTARSLLTAPTLGSVSVRTESLGSAVTNAYLDTPEEEVGPAAQVHMVSGWGFSTIPEPDSIRYLQKQSLCATNTGVYDTDVS